MPDKVEKVNFGQIGPPPSTDVSQYTATRSDFACVSVSVSTNQHVVPQLVEVLICSRFKRGMFWCSLTSL